MSFKDYALSHQTEICLELERVKLLLQKAGNPDRNLKIIHVAGTNGKGSVCSFVCSGLMHMKKKFGKFSSPELICINDTISVNGIDITNRELDSLLAFLSPLCDEVKSETGKAPSQFEICFVAALLHFVSQKCEYAVLECGMGGMGDATNAIEDSYCDKQMRHFKSKLNSYNCTPGSLRYGNNKRKIQRQKTYCGRPCCQHRSL